MRYIDAHIEPEAIEKRSFEIIDSEVPKPRPFEGNEWLVVRRMIHTTADFELLSIVKFHSNAIKSGVGALKSGCLIVTDTEMARMGIPMGHIERLGCRVVCYINETAVKDKAQKEKTTRASAAVDFALSSLVDRAIFVVGNAPTALLRLLKRVKEVKCNPTLIVGMPVGFVNAAKSKEMLMEQAEVPYITIRGRKGGSDLAACVVNQLAEIALEGNKK